MVQDLIAAACGFAIVTTITALGWLIRWASGHMRKRIDDAWKASDANAPKEEPLRVRDTQKDIFETLATHDWDDVTRHAQAQQLGRVEAKMDALLSRRRGGEDNRIYSSLARLVEIGVRSTGE